MAAPANDPPRGRPVLVEPWLTNEREAIEIYRRLRQELLRRRGRPEHVVISRHNDGHEYASIAPLWGNARGLRRVRRWLRMHRPGRGRDE